MDRLRFIKWKVLVIFAIVVVIMTVETTSSHTSGTGKRAIEIITPASELNMSELNVLRGLDLKKGDSHKGIMHTKLYLARFGYLSQQKWQEDSLFDERLREGLLVYQSSFNLNVAGFLDQETLDTMLIPRCGREDVPDVSLLFLPRPLPSESDFWNHGQWKLMAGRPKWLTTHDLTYAFSSTISHAESAFLSKEDIRSAVAFAFDSWAEVVPLNFSETTEFEKANIKIEFVGNEHGDGVPFDGTVAHAFPPEDGRFHFNRDMVWMTSFRLSPHSSAIDIESTAFHEIGHIIGLGHSKHASSVMYPSLPAGDVKNSLSADDICAARALYGTRIPHYEDQQDYHQQEEEGGNEDDEPHQDFLLSFRFLTLVYLIFFVYMCWSRHISLLLLTVFCVSVKVFLYNNQNDFVVNF